MTLRKIQINVAAYESENSYSPVWCGMQYEDNATTITFYPDDEILAAAGEEPFFRIDFNSESGYNPSQNLTPDSDGGFSRDIPYSVTRNEGYSEAVFVIGNAVSEILSFPVKLTFTPVERSPFGGDPVYKNISSMEKSVNEAMEVTLAEAKTVKELAESIEATNLTAEVLITATDEAKTLVTSVTEMLENGEFKGEKGDKGDPGKDGADGKDGLNGRDGADGKDGENGKDAVTDQVFDSNSPNAQSGIAVAEAISGKAEKLKDYELIDTITLEEGVKSITLTNEPDGTPYNFEKICIFIAAKVATKTTALSWIINGAYCSGQDYALHTNWGALSIFECSIDKQLNKYRATLTNHTNSWGNPPYSGKAPFILKGTSGNPFNKINLYQSTDDTTLMPAGTTFEIWGVRA